MQGTVIKLYMPNNFDAISYIKSKYSEKVLKQFEIDMAVGMDSLDYLYSCTTSEQVDEMLADIELI
jgi:hypothetical protein